jgi:hypothetical protein
MGEHKSLPLSEAKGSPLQYSIAYIAYNAYNEKTERGQGKQGKQG